MHKSLDFNFTSTFYRYGQCLKEVIVPSWLFCTVSPYWSSDLPRHSRLFLDKPFSLRDHKLDWDLGIEADFRDLFSLLNNQNLEGINFLWAYKVNVIKKKKRNWWCCSKFFLFFKWTWTILSHEQLQEIAWNIFNIMKKHEKNTINDLWKAAVSRQLKFFPLLLGHYK